MKLMGGVRKFLEEDNVEVEGLEPAIDSAAFSLTAWQQILKSTLHSDFMWNKKYIHTRALTFENLCQGPAEAGGGGKCD
jgi:hypothetical protein